MQPINIEPISIVAIIIIVVTLIYSFFKYRLGDKKETAVIKEQKSSYTEKDVVQYELPVIIAAITTMMEQKPFKIKNIIIGKGEEISTWRQSGRQEIMRRRANMQR
jgi:hypothetical protein